MKRIITTLFLSALYYIAPAQYRNVYVVFTGVVDKNAQQGISQYVPQDYNKQVFKYPYYIFTIFYTGMYSYGYDHEYVINNPSRQQTIRQYPKSFINQQQNVIDWDIVGPALTTEAAAEQKIREIEKYDKIYFIDRNDFTKAGKIKVIEVKRFHPPTF